MQTPPYLVVLPSKFVPGVSAETLNTAETCYHLPLREALERQYATDAHLVMYTSPHRELLTRMSKPGLPSIRERFGPDCLKITTLFVDFDNPGHAEWTPEFKADFLSKLQALPAKIRQACGILYSTRAGARLGFILERAIELEQSEPMLRGLVYELGQAGMIVDPLCDWTRVFRMPFVKRDGEWSQEHMPFGLVIRDTARLALDAIEPIGKESRLGVGPALPLQVEQPTPEQAKAELEGSGRHRTKTQWYKKVKRLLGLYDAPSFPYIFEGRVPAVGTRNQSLAMIAGDLTGALFEESDSTPERVWALMVPLAENMEGSDGGTPWTDVAWAMVCRFWSQDAGRRQTKEQVKLDTKHAILQGVREWCNHTGVEQTADAAIIWLMKRMIAVSADGRSCWVMTKSGYYDRHSVARQTLHARIRDLGMDEVIQIHRMTTQGGVQMIKSDELISRHGTTVGSVEGIVGDVGTTIRGLGTKKQLLRYSIYARKDSLEPRFDKDVDGWLRAMLGEFYDRVVEWLGHSLAFEDGPICALSLVGPPGCGKSLLVQGLAECVDTEIVATGEELIRDRQSRLLETPWLNVNEGFPRAVQNVDVADKVRQIISGDVMEARRLYEGAVKLHNPVRLLITANNEDCIRTVFKNKNMDEDDREALAQRILHIRCSKRAVVYFDEHGGRKMTNGWVAGATGHSNYTLARHFLSLYRHRAPTHGRRWLVEGDNGANAIRNLPTLVQMMAMESGIVPIVTTVLIQMLEQNETEGKGWFIDLELFEFHVTGAGVRQFWDVMREGKSGYNPIDYRNVSRALAVLKEPKGLRKGPYALKHAGLAANRVRMRWMHINLEMLLKQARETGEMSARLIAMVKQMRIAQHAKDGRFADPSGRS